MTGQNQPSSLYARRGANSLWRTVVEAIRKDIIGGTYKPGERLPTETELATIFGVHRNTVRRAFAVLKERDYVRIEQGRGTFVKERVVHSRLGVRSRLSATVRDMHRISERRFVGSARVRVDKDLARDLRLPQAQFARRVDTLTLIDGIAASIASSYFPLPRFEGIEALIEQTGSLTESWKHFGILDYHRFETRISAGLLSQTDSLLLSLPRRQPVILMTNINVDVDGVPIVVTRGRMAPQHMEVVIRFSE
ncbi:phosphonate metabolism transcriptional regulator PhnF [Bradyrhizobium elkanii]|uniref:phosphonate metabolism transcriptional regulator PhnF n=1 Tax=Bradyrhizobium elkanii TaxID=29448 RepID=UPI001449E5C0|nr:phosphonate metabolism transcriptional regulator PhnF [Bradyrhizobium elkanii]MCP1927764.1 GntR family phosphonate transport system transcriptional regulator [Bradyrhizobium elkanii]MCS3581627.1 GntR family phosphonate transport system transcriptional regulator [Bradyrhizobium elkanii]MCS3724501.1 GntR family phosphonate transport system transcriptional regulator [Bradyrhizobium elkanii]MCS4008913.1 GntR family phosphonate transport system transcriptional regulator [Bradyrhizobium elkanii US